MVGTVDKSPAPSRSRLVMNVHGLNGIRIIRPPASFKHCLNIAKVMKIELPFGELELSACTALAVFFTFDLAWVTGEEVVFPQHRLE